MVLGQDFHSEFEYEESFRRGYEIPNDPTWRSLLALLGAAGIDRGKCFFTNLFMGLREGRGTTGRFPGARDPGFVSRCLAFLRRQIETQRPRLIIVLGGVVPHFLAALSPDLAGWRGVRGFGEIDQRGPLVPKVKIDGLDSPLTMVVLTHPSMRGPNVWRRRYGQKSGLEAEHLLLADAMKVSRS
jgi:uracil-DNA glycosylase family 4